MIVSDFSDTITVIAIASAEVTSFFLQNLKLQFTIGLQLRTCLTSALYKKALVLAPEARQETTVGQVVFLSSSSSSPLRLNRDAGGEPDELRRGAGGDAWPAHQLSLELPSSGKLHVEGKFSATYNVTLC